MKIQPTVTEELQRMAQNVEAIAMNELPLFTTLYHVDYDERLRDELLQAWIEGDYDTLHEGIDDATTEARHDAGHDEVKTIVERVAVREYGNLADAVISFVDTMDLLMELMYRDDSDTLTDLVRNTHRTPVYAPLRDANGTIIELPMLDGTDTQDKALVHSIVDAIGGNGDRDLWTWIEHMDGQIGILSYANVDTMSYDVSEPVRFDEPILVSPDDIDHSYRVKHTIHARREDVSKADADRIDNIFGIAWTHFNTDILLNPVPAHV